MISTHFAARARFCRHYEHRRLRWQQRDAGEHVLTSHDALHIVVNRDGGRADPTVAGAAIIAFQRRRSVLPVLSPVASSTPPSLTPLRDARQAGRVLVALSSGPELHHRGWLGISPTIS